VVNKNITTIEINGTRYNALTGALLDVAAPVAVKQRAMDDIVLVKSKPAVSIQQLPRAGVAAKISVPSTTPRKVMDIARPNGQHVKAHKHQPAKTLMRRSVHKPDPHSNQHRLKAQTRTDVLAKVPSVAVLPKFSFHQVDPGKLRRAERIAKSHLVRRFAPLPVTDTTTSVPVHAAAIRPNTQPAAITPGASPRRSMDVFERAIARANAHEQPRIDPKKLAKGENGATMRAKQKS